MASPKKNNLGRGLGSLIAGAGFKKPEPAPAASKPAAQAAAPAEPAAPAADAPFREVPVAKIVPAKWQPRREFAEAAIDELAESIRAEGLIQPVTVRPAGDGFELIAGERRLRAFRKLGIKTIPARVIKASDAGSAAMTLIENLQRENLNPVEEALGYASLMRDFHLTQDAVSERVGKPRATVANTVRLLALDRETQGYIVSGRLSAGHAKVLLGLELEAERVPLARKVVKDDLSVRELEQEVRKLKAAAVERAASGSGDPARAAKTTAAIMDIEKRLVTRLNTKVRVKHGAKRGVITIEYHGNDDLSRILAKIGVA